MEQALADLIEEFRAPPGTSAALAEVMLSEWAPSQLLERYELTPEMVTNIVLVGVAEQVRREVEADPLATPQQIKARINASRKPDQ